MIEKKKQVTVRMDLKLYNRARAAVLSMPETTLTSLVADGLAEKLDALEAQRGAPFTGGGPLHPGKPIGSPVSFRVSFDSPQDAERFRQMAEAWGQRLPGLDEGGAGGPSDAADPS